MAIADELNRIAKGEILSDNFSRQYFSVDASYYEITPEVIVRPHDADDLSNICKFCSDKSLNMTARGAGTGLLGQCLGSGVILDFTGKMNKVLEITGDLVRVQPGAIKASLDKELRKCNKYLPPDPASSNYCTIGGMIANNSSGIHSLQHGSTIDFLERVKLVYADGSQGFAGSDGWDQRMEKLRSLLPPDGDWLVSKFPRVSKNSCGYRLDAVVQKGFQPQKLLAASEGTLGLLTEITLRIKDLPEFSSLVVLAFKDILEAAVSVPRIIRFNPSAVEILDHTAAKLGGDSGKGCIMFVEFAGGNRRKIDEVMRRCLSSVSGTSTIIEESSDNESISKVWQARKAALNNIMKITLGGRKPLGLIEDTVVSPEYLVDHISQILKFYHTYKFDYAMYGHAGDGNIHTRPMINIDSPAEMRAMEQIARTLFASVATRGGTITGEHGDGLERVGYIESLYAPEIVSLFRRVKECFDSGYLLNRGKKILVRPQD